jgi:hypothetical protein
MLSSSGGYLVEWQVDVNGMNGNHSNNVTVQLAHRGIMGSISQYR